MAAFFPFKVSASFVSCIDFSIRGHFASRSTRGHPFINIPGSPTTRRDRVLADDELVALWRATGKPGAFNGILRTLVLTGQRLTEVSGMAWAELSADLSTWTIPAHRAKNGKTHIVPLSRQSQDLLRVLRDADLLSFEETLQDHQFGELVFPGLRSAFSGWGKAKSSLDARSDVTGWRLHDLRRTMATGLQRLGVRLEVTEAVLNHISGSRGGIVGIYQRHDWQAEKRIALDAWGAHVMAIVEGRAVASNITELKSLRR